MESVLKYLLLPVTIIVSFLLASYMPYVAVIGAVKLFSFSWLVLIFLGTILFGIIYFVIIGLPNLIRIGINLLYKQTPFIMILHGIAGIIGTIWIISFFINQPPMLVEGEREYFFIKWMWQHAPLKALFVLLGLIPFVFMMIYNSTIMPFVLFFEMQNDIRLDKEIVIVDQRNGISEAEDYGKEHTIEVEDYPNDRLKPLEIQSTNNTPYVSFQPDGNLLIQGRYIPEDITEFSERLLDWVNNYIETPVNHTILTLEFEYINDASKYLLILIKKLEKHCPDFFVDWIYEEVDTDMLVLGEIMNDSCQTDFNFISK